MLGGGGAGEGGDGEGDKMRDGINVVIGIIWWLCRTGVCDSMIVACLSIFPIYDDSRWGGGIVMAIGVVVGGLSCIIVWWMGASEGNYVSGGSMLLCAIGFVVEEKGGSGRHIVARDDGT